MAEKRVGLYTAQGPVKKGDLKKMIDAMKAKRKIYLAEQEEIEKQKMEQS